MVSMFRRARRRDECREGDARDGAGAWREAFLRMPYLRDMLVRLGILSDTRSPVRSALPLAASA